MLKDHTIVTTYVDASDTYVTDADDLGFTAFHQDPDRPS
tara:strand:- start:517 stop:633 length:117 start_codon:yes stop_codon:yes gene_type:complete